MNDILNSKEIVVDNQEYKVIKKINGDILLRKYNYVYIKSCDDFSSHDFVKSVILSCSINSSDEQKLKYRSILESIYMIINDGSKIIKKSKLNIKTLKKKDEGYYYLYDLGISIQGVGSNKCLAEIINQVEENKIKLSMKIKMNNGIIAIVKIC